jgi:tetratricopeptide (TPR) repeat protein
MRFISRMMILVAVAMATVFISAKFCSAKMPSPATPFSLKDVKGRTYDLSAMKSKPLMIVYFFDVDKPPHVEELLVLDGLTKKYRDADLTVWGITRSDKSEVMNLLKKTNIGLPILFDNSNVSDRYDAIRIRPTTCIIGPNLNILNHLTGTSRRAQKVLVKLAERKLQQNKPEFAKNIGNEVLQENPKNNEAIAVIGKSFADMDNFKEAEKMAKKLIAKKGPSEIAGKEILAKVYIRQGKTDEALKIIKEVMKKAPNRAWPHILKGDILYSQGKKKETEAEYQAAIKATEAEPNNIAVANNHIGRMELHKGKTKDARKYANTAEKISPHVIENMTLRGQTYEKEGRLDEARKAYLEAQSIDRKDFFVEALAIKAQEMLDLQKDAERRNQIKELADRFRTMKDEKKPAPEDTWTTSKLMTLFFSDFKEENSMAAREGFSTVLIYHLAKQLNASGRVHVVDRNKMDLLLQELNLGSSALADPKTRRKLGRLWAAKIIGVGNISNYSGSTHLSLRLLEVETSRILEIIQESIGPRTSMQKEAHRLNRGILTSVIKNYPLQAYVVEATDAQVIINIGPDMGVVLGTNFDVVEDQPSIEYRGKILHREPKKIAQIKITGLEEDFCYGQVVYADPDIKVKKDDKLKETIKFDEK